MTAPNDPLEAGLDLARAFEAAGIPYALGGALAYGIWGIPRATLDVDINIFVVFTPSIPFSREAERTRREIEIEGQRAYFLSAEALAVFKLLFYRPKDLVDLERLVEVQGDALDVAYVRREIVTMMGEDDVRVQRWDQIAMHRSGPASPRG